MLQVTCAIIIQNKKILITQNSANSDHPFQWEFPGGKTKNGESYEQCIIREIQEELDIHIRVREALIAVEYNYGIKQIRLIPFICTIKNGDIKLNHHHQKDWVSIKQLPEIDFSEADKKLISLDENLQILQKYTGEQVDQSR